MKYSANSTCTCMYNIMSVHCSLDYMNQINDEGCHPKKVILCKQQS